MNVSQLLKQLKRFRPRSLKSGASDFKKVSFQYLKTRQLLRFSAQLSGTTEPGVHKQVIEFDGVEHGTKRDTVHKKLIKSTSGVRMWLKPVELSKNEVRVRCSCSDYYYTFWIFNKRHNAHQGANMPPYKPVGGKSRPPRNELGVPGACKHILGLLVLMREKGWIK